MSYIIGAATNTGIKKQNNQDSVIVKKGTCGGKNVCLAIICDGMGGLEKGELASATVIRRFDDWFMKDFPLLISSDKIMELIKDNWDKILKQLNEDLINYGNNNRCNMGTTISAVITVNNEYLIVNVGDTRTYLVNQQLLQITEDQSLVAREIKMGRLTLEQAVNDPRRNVLLQCIGVTSDIVPDYYNGSIGQNEGFLICSDGFRHMVSEKEIFDKIDLNSISSEEDINGRLTELILLNMTRKETDNISAIIIKNT